MEDFEIIRSIQKKGKLKIIPKVATVSARKYEKNHYLRVNLANFMIYNLWRLGVSHHKLAKLYRKLLN
jgi:hypothetical protein